MRPVSAVGRTKDAGWQIGVSRTFGVDVEVAWSVLTEGPGLAVWLGGGSDLPTKPGDPYTTAEGTTGELRSRRPLDRVRLTWQPRGRSTPTTLQVAVSPAASGTTCASTTSAWPTPRSASASATTGAASSTGPPRCCRAATPRRRAPTLVP